ncbi:methionine ABC transporter ATP-binding protein [Clostridium carboxidivorans P7]|uniref:ABC transporter related protein n=1 Tax=Clostridium carboxidivorans P7 TaxID=536227 RepID=C6PWX3_9CLOT|nr:ATP-binding cassette domain-containing protein [Clostridium carboxidivorans]AKN32162.1 methionine ABC transporter ATP-binding protein [Clostridium carboxidivorans P7]EET86279.1 ABC transporter related protein [Clostridium carboxidivorans P7]
MCILKFSNVSFKDDNKYILKNISLSINEGDFVSIVGPSGSGKSTFLKLCSSLISPDEGDILFKNKNFKEYDAVNLRKKVSYCFQIPYLFDHTVEDNLKFPYVLRNKTFDISRVKELFNIFNMDISFIKKEVNNLSGGEKQRIALIRNLLFEPDILLLDEVTSALDKDNTLIVENVIKLMNKRGITILWVTHNEAQSRKYANKLITIESGLLKNLEVLK